MSQSLNMYRLFLVALLGCCPPLLTASPCLNYTDIGYEYRSVAYVRPPSESYMCDVNVVNLPGQWYRFIQYTGEMMPEYCPPRDSCGTQFPVWLNGTHPQVANVETDAVACRHQAVCCDFPEPMQVMLCAEGGERYYVYQLPVIDGCPVSYCAGEMVPCEFSQRWDYDNHTCVDKETTPKTTTTTATTTTSSQYASTSIGSSTTTTTGDQQGGYIPGIGLIVALCLVCGAVGAGVAGLFFWRRTKKKPMTPNKVCPEDARVEPTSPPAYATNPPPYSVCLDDKLKN